MAGGECESRLLSLSRHGRCLLSELRLQVASRVLATGRSWRRVRIDSINGEDLTGMPPRERDAAVCKLKADRLGRVAYTLLGDEDEGEEEVRPSIQALPHMPTRTTYQQDFIDSLVQAILVVRAGGGHGPRDAVHAVGGLP